MREDLIERLRAYITQREKIRDGGITITECNGVPLTLTDLREAAAALESNAPVGMEAAVERLKDRTFPKHECPAESAAVWNTALYEMQRVLTQQPGGSDNDH